MQHELNPFQELYVTDDPNPGAYVQLFSDVPIHNAQVLFRAGNVVVQGLQGSGKSMLLNLFRPTTRVAYHEAHVTFPVPEKLTRYIGAGINLLRSGALDIGQLILRPDQGDNDRLYPLYFADFLNYYIVKDILVSVDMVRDYPDVFPGMLDATRLDEFAVELCKDDCWFGALEGCTDFEKLRTAINERIMAYRKMHLDNEKIPPTVDRTKTDIGEPIAKTADYLKKSQAVPTDVSFFIRIDEVDRLLHQDIIAPELGRTYRQIINKALGKRDQRVSYRIGTRPYGWGDDLQCYGTASRLEVLRDYRIVDLDRMNRRLENRKGWVFPGFARDVLKRRLNAAGYDTKGVKDFISKIFGVGQDISSTVRRYIGNSSADRLLAVVCKKWPRHWQDFLEDLFREDPFEAVLASAWALQGVKKKDLPNKRLEAPPPSGPAEKRPWRREYWRKERVRQCLLQIAARAGQRLEWSGEDSIIALSGGNISVFLSVCHEVWEAHLRHNRHRQENQRKDPVTGPAPIEHSIQSVGIHAASTDWYHKIAELPGGHDRRRFVKFLGEQFRQWLRDDPAMSYPGWNGFSIEEELIPEDKEYVLLFLRRAADYGGLYAHTHTSRSKGEGQRTKWYLNPIFSPYFQIPESHVKEPRYIESVEEIEEWLRKAEVSLGMAHTPRRSRNRDMKPGESADATPDMFGGDGDENG